MTQSRYTVALFTKTIFSEPLWTAYTAFLMTILYKGLSASALEITFFTMLKPSSALLALYWSASVFEKTRRLLSNIVVAEILGKLPFVFMPLFPSAEYAIFASGMLMFMHRGAMPAWMELLKQNIDAKKRSQLFTSSQTIAYIEGIACALFFGVYLDHFPQMWPWLFCVTGLFSLVPLFFLFRLKKPSDEPMRLQMTLEHGVFHPWKTSLQTLQKNPSFCHFQIGFMICGLALMIIAPVLPIYFVDVLDVRYTDLSLAIGLSKGFGYALSARLWPWGLHRFGIMSTACAVQLLFALFAAVLLNAQYLPLLFFFSYLLYGAAQGGSELSWHMSGPIFSGNDDSTPYSGVNILTVGLRGLVGPPLGMFLLSLSSCSTMLAASCLLSLLAALWMGASYKLSPLRT